jgi:hypothetical protein
LSACQSQFLFLFGQPNGLFFKPLHEHSKRAIIWRVSRIVVARVVLFCGALWRCYGALGALFWRQSIKPSPTFLSALDLASDDLALKCTEAAGEHSAHVSTGPPDRQSLARVVARVDAYWAIVVGHGAFPPWRVSPFLGWIHSCSVVYVVQESGKTAFVAIRTV